MTFLMFSTLIEGILFGIWALTSQMIAIGKALPDRRYSFEELGSKRMLSSVTFSTLVVISVNSVLESISESIYSSLYIISESFSCLFLSDLLILVFDVNGS